MFPSTILQKGLDLLLRNPEAEARETASSGAKANLAEEGDVQRIRGIADDGVHDLIVRGIGPVGALSGELVSSSQFAIEFFAEVAIANQQFARHRTLGEKMA